MPPRSILPLLLSLSLVAGCGAAGAHVKDRPDHQGCVLIVTDDDIPSGSATAGALYVPNAALGKRLLTADVVALVKGFRAAGRRCVEVVDSHDGAIDPAPLKAMGVPLLTPSNQKGNWTWPFFGPMHLKRRTMAALVGFHSPAGAVDGFRAHTINDSVRGLWINGKPAGEVAHLMLGLSALGVPVVLVHGDHNATAEAAALAPKIEQVTVRWRGKKGEARYLSQDAAARQLAAAAGRAVEAGLRPVSFTRPVRVDLELRSTSLVADRSRGISRHWRAVARAMPSLNKLVGPFDFDQASLKVSGRRLSWRAEDSKRAFATIAFAASYMRGKRNWDQVSEGFRAYRAGKHRQAVAAYREALKLNPHDEATRCRMAAALERQGQLAEAHALFSRGVERGDELGSHQLQGWCLLGKASTSLALGLLADADKSARALLALPDFKGRHAEARGMIDDVACLRRGRPAAFDLRCRRAELRFVLGKLETVYSYLSYKQRRHGFSYAALRRQAWRQVEAATDEATYRAALAALLARFKDGHLRIKYPPAARNKKGRKLPPAVSHRWLPGRVLLTRVRRLWGERAPIREGLARGLARLRRARALVVDLRGNGGGDDSLAFEYITRMAAKPIPLGRLSLRISGEAMAKSPGYARIFRPDPGRPGWSRWREHALEPKTKKSFAGPVAVLIDRRCYSSCESTALAFRQSGLARLYGQTTGGGSANPVFIDLPISWGRLMVATWHHVMPNGEMLEDNGGAPHVVLPAGEDSLRRALVDIRARLRKGRGKK